jgi:hypothetical protein
LCVPAVALTIRGMDPDRIIGLSRRPDGAVVIAASDGRTHVCYTDTQIAAAIRKIMADKAIAPPSTEPGPKAGRRKVAEPPPGQRGTDAEIEAGRVLADAAIDEVAGKIAEERGDAVAGAAAFVARRAGRGIFRGLRGLSRRGPPPKTGVK